MLCGFVMNLSANEGSFHKEAEIYKQVDKNLYRKFGWNFSQTENERVEKKGENRNLQGFLFR